MQDPLGTIKVVIVTPAVRDPALSDEMDFDVYIKTRDPALVKVKEGMTATWFHVAPLKQEWVAEKVDCWPSDSQRCTYAFLGAVHTIDPADGPQKLAPTQRGAYGQRFADMAWMKGVAAKYGLLAVYELGSLAHQRSQLPEDSHGPFSL